MAKLNRQYIAGCTSVPVQAEMAVPRMGNLPKMVPAAAKRGVWGSGGFGGFSGVYGGSGLGGLGFRGFVRCRVWGFRGVCRVWGL